MEVKAMSEETKSPEETLEEETSLAAEASADKDVPVEVQEAPEEAAKLEEAPKPEPRTVPTRDDVTMAALAHASILVTFLIGVGSGGLGAILGVLIPLAIWYSYRDKSTFTANQALHATVYQVACVLSVLAFAVVGSILVVVGWTVSAALTAILIGLCLMPFALLVTLLLVAGVLALPIVQLVYGLYAAYEVYQGRDFRYKWVSDWVDQQDWK
jgi:uncharacterized Tic20 family protein